MKRLTIIGFTISVLWLIVVTAMLLGKSASLHDVKLNEWGDFLGGISAPLALIWVVIGYFQQGEELRLNTEALKAQQDELRRQVAETAVLAANSDRQAKAAEQMAFVTREESERAKLKELADAQPVLRAQGGQQTGGTVETVIRNAGATITKIKVATGEGGVTIGFEPENVFEQGKHGKLRLHSASRFPLEFTFAYTDSLGNSHVRQFEMTRPHELTEKFDAASK